MGSVFEKYNVLLYDVNMHSISTKQYNGKFISHMT